MMCTVYKLLMFGWRVILYNFKTKIRVLAISHSQNFRADKSAKITILCFRNNYRIKVNILFAYLSHILFLYLVFSRV